MGVSYNVYSVNWAAHSKNNAGSGGTMKLKKDPNTLVQYIDYWYITNFDILYRFYVVWNLWVINVSYKFSIIIEKLPMYSKIQHC